MMILGWYDIKVVVRIEKEYCPTAESLFLKGTMESGFSG